MFTDEGFNVIEIKASEREVAGISTWVDAILIYGEDDLDVKKEGLVAVNDFAMKRDIPIYVMGALEDIEAINRAIPEQCIYKVFRRPINVSDVVDEVISYIEQATYADKKKILVVDDSGAVLRNMKEWLGRKYQVTMANSAAAGFKYLNMNKPDLIILDYEMPVCNGKQFLEMLRAETELSKVPVIFLTNRADKETVVDILNMKVSGYMLKSMKPGEIIKSVDEFFSK